MGQQKTIVSRREDLEPEKLFVQLQCKVHSRPTICDTISEIEMCCLVKPEKALISHLGWY